MLKIFSCRLINILIIINSTVTSYSLRKKYKVLFLTNALANTIFSLQLADWWLKTAYLEYRKPVIVYSSPGLVWPKKTFRNQTEQLLFTAHLIAFALEFNTLVEE